MVSPLFFSFKIAQSLNNHSGYSIFQFENNVNFVKRDNNKKIGLRWLNTVLAVCEYMSFAKSWREKSCSSQVETFQVKNILMKDFD